MAPLYLGSTAISKVYKGTTELAQAYLEDNALLVTAPTGTDHCLLYTSPSPRD